MSGKTTTALLLAKTLHFACVDTDKLIEETYAKKTHKTYSCKQIFLEEGERFFRELEKEQIASLQRIDHHVIAIGGGSLEIEENREILKKLGLVVYLKTTEDILWKRMQVKEVPAYLDHKDPQKSFHELIQRRSKVYEQLADQVLETPHLTVEEVVSLFLSRQVIYHGK